MSGIPDSIRVGNGGVFWGTTWTRPSARREPALVFTGADAIEAGPDLVEVSGVKGVPPPATLKVSCAYGNGFSAKCDLVDGGRPVRAQLLLFLFQRAGSGIRRDWPRGAPHLGGGAIAIQLIINRELGLVRNGNPLQGSHFLAELTAMVEAAVLRIFGEPDARGGVLGRISKALFEVGGAYRRNA